MPLKGIPAILSPDLLRVLAQMGHGDEIVLADAHFPTSSVCASGPLEIRADGHGIAALLEAILKLLPLDEYVPCPVAVMEQAVRDKGSPVTVWEDYRPIINKAEGKQIDFEYVERFQFYERAKKSFALVHTGELAKYGNIILKKGLVMN